MSTFSLHSSTCSVLFSIALLSIAAPVQSTAFATDGPMTGSAVIYSDSMNGKSVVMKGEHYDKNGMTAATHSGFPIGSSVKVTNLANNKSVVVKVNDRMNPKSKSIIDLSRKAAEELDMMQAGHVKVRVEVAGK